MTKRPFTSKWAGKQGKGWTNSSKSIETGVATDLPRLLELQHTAPGQSLQTHDQSYPCSTAWLPGVPCSVATYTMLCSEDFGWASITLRLSSADLTVTGYTTRPMLRRPITSKTQRKECMIKNKKPYSKYTFILLYFRASKTT